MGEHETRDNKKLLTKKHVVKLLDINAKQLANWVDRGIIVPSIRGRGSGSYHLYDRFDVLWIAIARDMRRRGHTFDAVRALLNFLRQYGELEILEAWSQARFYALLVGDKVMFRLMSAEEIEANPEIDLLAAHMAGMPCTLINTKVAYDKLMSRLRELQEEAVA